MLLKHPLLYMARFEERLRKVFLMLHEEVRHNKLGKIAYTQTSWSSRPNPEDQINRKPDDRKNDQMTKKQ